VIRALAALALAIVALAGSGAMAAAAPPAVTPAPGGGAEASALQASPFDTCVSCTSVSAGPDGTSSRATALRLLGHDVAGGTSHNGSSQHDALLALPSNPVFDLAVASWWTDTQTAGPPAAESRTALVDAGVLPSGEDSTTGGLVTVALLESFGDATWSGSGSRGYAAGNGADIGLANGALVIILLHSQATSDHHGNAYLASVNGASLLGTGGESAGTPVEVPGVLQATLFKVGATGGQARSAVGTVDRLLDIPGLTAGLLTSAARGLGAGTADAAAVPPPAGDPAATIAPRGAVGVPSTGTSPGVAGLLLGLAGATVAAVSLRRRRPG
jgi:LPXTG-motif cell wall-anchored protein